MDKHLHVNESVVSFQMVIKSKHLVSVEGYMIHVLCKWVKRYGDNISGLIYGIPGHFVTIIIMISTNVVVIGILLVTFANLPDVT